MARDFRKLTALQKADDLAVAIYRATELHFTGQERFGLTAQLRSAAVSVPANIAEGSGRETLRDFRRFLFPAQGSLSEVEYYLHLSNRLGILGPEDFDGLESLRAEVGRTLYGFIVAIGRKVEEGETT